MCVLLNLVDLLIRLDSHDMSRTDAVHLVCMYRVVNYQVVQESVKSVVKHARTRLLDSRIAGPSRRIFSLNSGLIRQYRSVPSISSQKSQVLIFARCKGVQVGRNAVTRVFTMCFFFFSLLCTFCMLNNFV